MPTTPSSADGRDCQPTDLGDEHWWKGAVVYQVYPRSFADGDGDGIGDLAGLRQRLPHLTDLGVDVVWLSPVYPSPQDDNGYDISDYRDIDPTFGTLAEFDDLIEDMHARGLRLVMDLVVNHTSDEHRWFQESRDPDSERRDWYWWRPPRDGVEAGEPGAEPTNWGSFFGGSTWELDDVSGEYYLHLFSRKQPDLNWEHPDVRAAVYDMMNWWLDRGVDGFRMDVVNLISKDVDLPDGDVPPGQRWGNARPHTASGPRIHEFLQEMHREVFAGRDAVDPLTVGEMIDVTVDQARLFTDQERHELDMVFTFEHVSLDYGSSRFDVVDLDLRDLKAVMDRWQRGLSDVGWNSLYLNNHDQPRSVSRYGDDGQYRARSATALATTLHLHRGTPYVFQGEEIGMANFPFTALEQFRDVETIGHHDEAVSLGKDTADLLPGLAEGTRDNSRTPMQWDATDHAGFTSGDPWIAVNPDHADWNVAAQVDDPDSVLAHYRRLIALRHDEATVVHGDFTMLLADHPAVYAFTRRLAEVELLVVANWSSSAQEVDLGGGWDGAEVVLANVSEPSHDVGSLQPWEARIHKRTTNPK